MVAGIPPSQRPSFPLDVDLSEPHAAATEAADETEMPLPPIRGRSFSVVCSRWVSWRHSMWQARSSFPSCSPSC